MSQTEPIKIEKPAAAAPAGESANMGLLGHLKELRRRIVFSLLALIAGFAVAYNLSDQILGFIYLPLKKVMPEGRTLIFTGLQDAFMLHLKAGLWGGLLLVSPFLFYQFWAFVAPGLYRTERRLAAGLTALGTVLLLLGVAFGYFAVLPLAFKFFLGYSGEMMTALPAGQQYFALAATLLIAFGFVFQLPLAAIFLAHLGLVDADFMRRYRKYAILMIFVGAAIITPPDAVSQCFMAVPMLLLYEASIVVVRRIKRKQEAAAAAEKTAEENLGGDQAA